MSDHLALLRELARADEACSATLGELDGSAREAAAIGARADELARMLEAAPSERGRLVAALEAARREAGERARALADAEGELVEAERRGDRDRVAAARRSQVRAADALTMARKRVESGEGEIDAYERRLVAAERETPVVQARAARAARALRGRPRVAPIAARPPGSGLAAVVEWARTARAALLVARSGAAAERDAVIRQANELGSALLGEQLVATSAASIARRVEEALRAEPVSPSEAGS